MATGLDGGRARRLSCSQASPTAPLAPRRRALRAKPPPTSGAGKRFCKLRGRDEGNGSGAKDFVTQDVDDRGQMLREIAGRINAEVGDLFTALKHVGASPEPDPPPNGSDVQDPEVLPAGSSGAAANSNAEKRQARSASKVSRYRSSTAQFIPWAPRRLIKGDAPEFSSGEEESASDCDGLDSSSESEAEASDNSSERSGSAALSEDMENWEPEAAFEEVQDLLSKLRVDDRVQALSELGKEYDRAVPLVQKSEVFVKRQEGQLVESEQSAEKMDNFSDVIFARDLRMRRLLFEYCRKFYNLSVEELDIKTPMERLDVVKEALLRHSAGLQTSELVAPLEVLALLSSLQNEVDYAREDFEIEQRRVAAHEHALRQLNLRGEKERSKDTRCLIDAATFEVVAGVHGVNKEGFSRMSTMRSMKSIHQDQGYDTFLKLLDDVAALRARLEAEPGRDDHAVEGEASANSRHGESQAGNAAPTGQTKRQGPPKRKLTNIWRGRLFDEAQSEENCALFEGLENETRETEKQLLSLEDIEPKSELCMASLSDAATRVQTAKKQASRITALGPGLPPDTADDILLLKELHLVNAQIRERQEVEHIARMRELEAQQEKLATQVREGRTEAEALIERTELAKQNVEKLSIEAAEARQRLKERNEELSALEPIPVEAAEHKLAHVRLINSALDLQVSGGERRLAEARDQLTRDSATLNEATAQAKQFIRRAEKKWREENREERATPKKAVMRRSTTGSVRQASTRQSLTSRASTRKAPEAAQSPQKLDASTASSKNSTQERSPARSSGQPGTSDQTVQDVPRSREGSPAPRNRRNSRPVRFSTEVAEKAAPAAAAMVRKQSRRFSFTRVGTLRNFEDDEPTMLRKLSKLLKKEQTHTEAVETSRAAAQDLEQRIDTLQALLVDGPALAQIGGEASEDEIALAKTVRLRHKEFKALQDQLERIERIVAQAIAHPIGSSTCETLRKQIVLACNEALGEIPETMSDEFVDSDA